MKTVCSFLSSFSVLILISSCVCLFLKKKKKKKKIPLCHFTCVTFDKLAFGWKIMTWTSWLNSPWSCAHPNKCQSNHYCCSSVAVNDVVNVLQCIRLRVGGKGVGGGGGARWLFIVINVSLGVAIDDTCVVNRMYFFLAQEVFFLSIARWWRKL